MTDTAISSTGVVDARIAALREQAGIKQADLARRVTWSAAILSRVESGERPAAAEELALLLDAIGTPEARSLSDVLDREWQIISRPPLDHPDQDELWQAELAARDLVRIHDSPDVRSVFQRRLSALLVGG